MCDNRMSKQLLPCLLKEGSLLRADRRNNQGHVCSHRQGRGDGSNQTPLTCHLRWGHQLSMSYLRGRITGPQQIVVQSLLCQIQSRHLNRKVCWVKSRYFTQTGKLRGVPVGQVLIPRLRKQELLSSSSWEAECLRISHWGKSLHLWPRRHLTVYLVSFIIPWVNPFIGLKVVLCSVVLELLQ